MLMDMEGGGRVWQWGYGHGGLHSKTAKAALAARKLLFFHPLSSESFEQMLRRWAHYCADGKEGARGMVGEYWTCPTNMWAKCTSAQVLKICSNPGIEVSREVSS